MGDGILGTLIEMDLPGSDFPKLTPARLIEVITAVDHLRNVKVRYARDTDLLLAEDALDSQKRRDTGTFGYLFFNGPSSTPLTSGDPSPSLNLKCQMSFPKSTQPTCSR